jgi:NAD(P)-dependent dehydrogenase (short-subunit alcohol dehydrogenase family)
MQAHRSPLRSDADERRVGSPQERDPASAAPSRSSWRDRARTWSSAAVASSRSTRCARRSKGWAARASPWRRTCANPDEVERVVSAALERFGVVDVLVNNAGGQFSAPRGDLHERLTRGAPGDRGGRLEPDPIRRHPLDDPGQGRPDRVHRLQPAARHPRVRARLGRAGRRGQPRLGPRHRVEPARDPDGLRGARPDPHRGSRAYDPDAVAAWTRAVPLGRLGRLEEVAGVIAFLASAGGAYVTGTTIVV